MSEADERGGEKATKTPMVGTGSESAPGSASGTDTGSGTGSGTGSPAAKTPVRSAAIVLALLTAANFLGYATRNALFQAYDDLRAHMHLDNEALGLLATAFMAAQAAATIPAGWAGDRFDRRKVIALGLLLASIAGLLGPLAGSYPALLVSRALVGFGLAAIVPVANSILGELFEGDIKASRIALFNLGLFIGGAVGFAGGDLAGYPWILYGCALPGFALALAIRNLPIAPRRATLSGDRTAGASAGNSLAGFAAAGVRAKVAQAARQVREVLRSRTLRLLMLSTTAMAFAAGGFSAWFADFLRHDKHLSDSQTTSVLIVSLVAGLAGVVTGGRLGDAWGRRTRAGRMWTIVVGMSGTVPAVVGCILLPAGPGLVAVSMATMFFISWYHAPMAATVDDLASPQRAATAQAVVLFTMHLLGTSPSSWAVGALIDRVGAAPAMFLPTGALAVAALAMAAAIPSFAADSDRVRPPRR
jgi:MFS transporter, Spinster family, sphingosine-1-phosphate transporter